MRRWIRQAFVYALGVALLMTLGMRFQTSDKHQDAAEPANVLPLLQLQLSPLSQPIVPLTIESGEPEIEKAPQATKKHNDIDLAAKVSIPTYEVTAYYLNVRANPYATSKILKVITKGTKLEVVKTTANDWLLIKGGGYVHGAYAQLVEGENTDYAVVEEVSEAVKTTSAVVEEASEPVKPTSAVKTDSGLTEDDIAVIFEGTALAGHGLEETILEVEEQYGINALFTIAVMKLESGNGKSRLAKSKNNLFGLNAISGDAHNKAFSFETKGDSVRKFGQLLSKNYVGKGYTTIEKIATKYCPANSKWSRLVKNIMNSDYGKL